MILKCIRILKWWILSFVVLGFVAQYLSSLGVVYFQELIDSISTSQNNTKAIYNIIYVYGVTLIASAIINYVLEYPRTYLSNKIVEMLKLFAVDKISKIDYKEYQSFGTGQVIKIIENGSLAGRDIIFSFYLRIFSELLPTLVFGFLFIGFYDSRILIFITIGYVFVFIITNLLLKVLFKYKELLATQQEQHSKFSVRGFMELVVFRVNKRYEKEIENLNTIANSIVNRNTQIKLVHESFFTLFSIIIVFIKLIVIYYGLNNGLAKGGTISIGAIVALTSFTDRIYSPIAIFNVLFVNYKLNTVVWKRFEDLYDSREDPNLEKGISISKFEGDIKFQKVNFQYGTVRILKDISFEIKKGTSVAFVGESGGGKSTIIKLLLGFLKKNDGSILFNSNDIDYISLNSLYDQISYIPQEPPIFDATIRENIVFDHKVPTDRIHEILKAVNLNDKVSTLPDGLETIVGEKGIKLSGGEKQKLAFARAIIQERNIIILDESFSNLDSIQEREIIEIILKLFNNKTIIMIDHRLQYLDKVDKIIVVKDGRVLSEGPFEELITESHYFKELWNKRFSNKISSPA